MNIISRDFHGLIFQAMDSNLRDLYDEELAVAKDAISNLRTSFK